MNAIYSEKRLESYARWYYGRYFPSIESLREKLLKKCENDHSKVAATVEKIREIFIEELLVDQHVRNLIDSHKNERIICQTLKRKKFDESLVEAKIEEYRDDLLSWEAHELAITKKWSELLKKGKSNKFITQALAREFPHFRDEILSLSEKGGESDDENIVREYEKLCKGKIPISHNEKQKIAAKLMQRGFGFDKIKRIVFT